MNLIANQTKYGQIKAVNGEEIIGTFYEKKLQKANQKEFRTEKVIKKKGDKQYVKWKGYSSSFNSWIDQKRQNINEPKSFGGRVKIEVDFSNNAT